MKIIPFYKLIWCFKKCEWSVCSHIIFCTYSFQHSIVTIHSLMCLVVHLHTKFNVFKIEELNIYLLCIFHQFQEKKIKALVCKHNSNALILIPFFFFFSFFCFLKTRLAEVNQILFDILKCSFSRHLYEQYIKIRLRHSKGKSLSWILVTIFYSLSSYLVYILASQ